MADGSAGLATSLLRKGTNATVTGIVGQRASRKGALDGYRLWVRDPEDVLASPSVLRIAELVGIAEGVRHAAGPARDDRSCARARGQACDHRGHRDAWRRRSSMPRAGGPSWRTALPRSSCTSPVPMPPSGPGCGCARAAWSAGHGARRACAWTRYASSGGASPAFSTCGQRPAQPPSGASSASAGRSPTSTGRATAGPPSSSPTASGSRSSACPAAASRHRRSRKAAGPPSRASSSDRTPRRRTSGSRSCRGRRATSCWVRPARARPRHPRPRAARPPARPPRRAMAHPSAAAPTPSGADVSLADLATRLGTMVRVGGLVTAVEADAFRLDDGTATATVVLEGPAVELAALLQPGDAVNADRDSGCPRRGRARRERPLGRGPARRPGRRRRRLGSDGLARDDGCRGCRRRG